MDTAQVIAPVSVVVSLVAVWCWPNSAGLSLQGRPVQCVEAVVPALRVRTTVMDTEM
jgi:hypothetical protein